MLNKNIAITTNWEIRLTDEQEQLVCLEAEKVVCSWKDVNSIADVDITSFDEVDWEDITHDAIYASEIYNYYQEWNKVFFLKRDDEYTTSFSIDNLPDDVYMLFYNHIYKVIQDYITKRNTGVL